LRSTGGAGAYSGTYFELQYEVNPATTVTVETLMAEMLVFTASIKITVIIKGRVPFDIQASVGRSFTSNPTPQPAAHGPKVGLRGCEDEQAPLALLLERNRLVLAQRLCKPTIPVRIVRTRLPSTSAGVSCSCPSTVSTAHQPRPL